MINRQDFKNLEERKSQLAFDDTQQKKNKNDNTIEVECILQYFKPCFNEEIEKYISNRGGIEYFFSKKQLNTNEGEKSNYNNFN